MCIISCRYYCLYTLLMSVGSLFAVFSLLFSRTAAVGTSDVFLFLGLRLHLAVVLLRFGGGAKDDAGLDDFVDGLHAMDGDYG